MLNISSVINVLAAEIYFLEKKLPIEFDFYVFLLLPEVVQIHHVNFETRSRFLYKFCTIL